MLNRIFNLYINAQSNRVSRYYNYSDRVIRFIIDHNQNGIFEENKNETKIKNPNHFMNGLN